MMARRLAFGLVALLVPTLLAAAPAAADGLVPFEHQHTTVAQLLADPEAYTTVVVRGELVGDFGVRGDGTVWAQLNDDPYVAAPLREGGEVAGPNRGIGVRFRADVWPGFDQPGGYRWRGPVVELTGEWRYHDPSRGGESYLDVDGVVLLAGPAALGEGVRWVPLGAGAGLLAAAGGLALLARRRRS